MVAELILASGSPRRRSLLEQIGLDFRVVIPTVTESFPCGFDLAAGVMELARRKAAFVAGQEKEGLVLGADTVVVLGNQILGKPSGVEGAISMLQLLQGREHQVITGVAVIEAQTGTFLLEHQVTRVWFRKLTEREINGYVATGEPLDKAGAYGIQGKGGLLVEGIEGCFFNVVGLPLLKTAQLLAAFGLDLWGG